MKNISKQTKRNTYEVARPPFYWASLANREIQNNIGSRVWCFIPKLWRYWWIDVIKETFPDIFRCVAIDTPEAYFVDKTVEIDSIREK